MPLRVYNTLTQTKEPFQTVVPGKVGMYVCGPTVYSPQPHRPHGRAGDLRHRSSATSSISGYEVTWVVNITDVDDKLIVQAAEGRDDRQGAGRAGHRRLPRAASRPSGVDGIDHMPRATEHIAEIIEITQGLIDKGFAYAVRRRRLLRRDQGRRLRQAQPPRPRGAAGRRPDRADRPRSGTRATSPSGRRRSPASRRGRAPGARAGPAGTSSARP